MVLIQHKKMELEQLFYNIGDYHNRLIVKSGL